MAELIRDERLTEDALDFPGEDRRGTPGGAYTLEDWLQADSPDATMIQLYPDDSCDALRPHLKRVAGIAVYFPVFSDGRGFSIARELREAGFSGELRARGHILPDQVHFLRRCGFNAFQPDDATRLSACLERLQLFSDHYQASIDQPVPRFRRRA
jgi:uncharacterized protein (DUF934 family)